MIDSAYLTCIHESKTISRDHESSISYALVYGEYVSTCH